MWPYTRKKTQFKHAGMSNLDLTRNSPLLTKIRKGNLDREYYNRLSSPVPGQLIFPANRIAEDGRVYSCYGLNNRDVTDLYGEDRPGRNKVQVNVSKPSKQLHERNVNRLKVVLSMPAKERRVSLSHVTGAIMRNEIVPTEARLQNDAFLSDYVRTSTPKLPPLKRKSLQLAKNIQVNIHTNTFSSTQRQPSSLAHYSGKSLPSDDEGSDVILPAITLDASSNLKVANDKFTPEEEMKAYRLRGALPTRRKSSFMRLIRANDKPDEKQQNTAKCYEKSLINGLDRRDSVGRMTESISEQFRAVIQEQMSKDKTHSAAGKAEPDFNLNIAGKSSSEALKKQLASEQGKNITNGYKLRHEYGKNLERNWFKNYVMKQSKAKTINQKSRPNSCGLRLDIFYSPEPESDSDINESDDGFLEDDASIQCGGFSTATAEARQRSKKSRRISNMSTGAIFEEDEPNTDEDSSQSDIEIVLKENQLIQRKTKHKMRKKRLRQLKRYKTFMPEETKVVPEVADIGSEVPLTDQEIRAIRLNLRNKERLKKLKGKRKFLQVANAVYIVAQFQRILKNIRKRKKNVIKKRQQRIAAMVAKRMAMKQAKEIGPEEEEQEREPTPKPTLKDQFMSEIGNKLVYELEKLNIDPGQETEEEESEDGSDVEQKKESTAPAPKCLKTNTSKFAAEIKKVSLNDVDRAFKSVILSRRLIKRRNSFPKGGRPLEFIIEVPFKPKRKTNKNKTGKDNGNMRFPRRPPSPEIKCRCYVHNKRLEAASRTSFTSQSRLGMCQHQVELKKVKMKKIRVPTGGLFRTQSLDNLAKRRPIELRELLKDIDIPAKEIKLQILDRKFRRQRKRRQRIRLSPCRLPEASSEALKDESDSGSDEAGSDDSDKSDYDFVYGGPFVGCGVKWHENSTSSRPRSWTAEDVDREVKKITRVFHELKECRYLRLDSFNAAIMAKLNENKRRL